jgi:hypothetical protein
MFPASTGKKNEKIAVFAVVPPVSNRNHISTDPATILVKSPAAISHVNATIRRKAEPGTFGNI